MSKHIKRTTVRHCDGLRKHQRNAVRMRVVAFNGGEAWSRYLWVYREEALEHYRELRRKGYDSLDAYHEAVFPRWSSGYGGPGGSFSTIPQTIKGRSRKWILWTQSGGWDI